jgi:hypothetical protein
LAVDIVDVVLDEFQYTVVNDGVGFEDAVLVWEDVLVDTDCETIGGSGTDIFGAAPREVATVGLFVEFGLGFDDRSEVEIREVESQFAIESLIGVSAFGGFADWWLRRIGHEGQIELGRLCGRHLLESRVGDSDGQRGDCEIWVDSLMLRVENGFNLR